MKIKNLDSIREVLKESLKKCSFENYLNPRYNLGNSDAMGAPSKLAKSLIEDRVDLNELKIQTEMAARQRGYEKRIGLYKNQIRKLKGKENYQGMLEACRESKRKAIEWHKKQFSNYRQ